MHTKPSIFMFRIHFYHRWVLCSLLSFYFFFFCVFVALHSTLATFISQYLFCMCFYFVFYALCSTYGMYDCAHGFRLKLSEYIYGFQKLTITSNATKNGYFVRFGCADTHIHTHKHRKLIQV